MCPVTTTPTAPTKLRSDQRQADVVVIGAGHNGLICANYLARAGHRVAVVERAPTPGGMTASGPLIPEAPNHIIHPCAVDLTLMMLTPIVRELGLERRGLRFIEPAPSYAYLHPDGATLTFWRDPVKTAAMIERYSPRDARAYTQFVRELTGLLAVAAPLMRADPLRPQPIEVLRSAAAAVKHRSVLRSVASIAAVSAEQVIAERFEHPMLINAMFNIAAGFGTIDTDASGLCFILLALAHTVGFARPVGGMQRLVDALVETLTDAGGAVFSGCPVDEILIEGDRAVGVRLAEGDEIRARAVVAACDPHTALRGLLPGGVLDQQALARVDHIPSNGTQVGVMKVDVALSGRLDMARHSEAGVDFRGAGMMSGTAEEVRENFAAARRGEIPERPVVWASVTSATDPSLAPPGQDVLYLYPLIMPLNPLGGWDSVRVEAEKRVMAVTSELFSDINELEIGRWVETPVDMQARTGAHNGCILHVDFAAFRAGPLRPAIGFGGYKTPVDGLFLGAAGSHPGGAVCGIPGRNAARRVDRHLARTERRALKAGVHR